ncbi:hemerythrin domain-containing protein [Geothrix sp. 21YS21S-2]|uniref:hemerythrin domain-containing protein n=1 Tax=Geothrix sp. 21YS21S-2 TaxID=3068893 RepID=UPI0027B8F346|nr:hemerythrin domain-containing protein [Geothrix sp. 21YS21S-2]
MSNNPNGRFDGYADIHKALRAFMGDTLAKVGSLDPEDPAETAAVTGQVGDLLRLCRTHLEHENDFIHTAMEARAPGSTQAFAEDHEGHERSLRNLWLDLDAVATGGEQAVARLYRGLAVFVAENLEHMDREEIENNAVLWANYTDAELIGIERALVASLKPEELSMALAWMIPALSPRQRAAKLAGIRAGAPEPMFRKVLDLVRPTLPGKGWEKLKRDLELAG